MKSSDVDVIRALAPAAEAELARRSFAEFVRQAWPLVPSVDPLVWGWHLDALCLHFEEVARGGITRLLVNVAPGHAKSVLLSVLWPAWVWTWWPRCQFLMGSYTFELAVRDSVRCRAVVESDWYQARFARPGGWRLRDDQNAKGYFVNTLGGERYSTGIGGTGRRAHIIGIDDPLAATDAYSKAARDEANTWIGQTLSQRFVDAKTGRVAMIMQRLHEEDPSGFVLAGEGWEHLCLPSEFDPERRCVTQHTTSGAREEFWRDPRTEEGALLFPEKFSREVLEDFKRPTSLGANGYAGQHQQRPTPASGGMFQRAWWRFWKPDGTAPDCFASRPPHCNADPARALPLLEQVIVSIDANFRDKAGADPVSIQVIGTRGADRFLLYRVHGPLGFTKTVEACRQVRRLYPRVRKWLIEARANGDAIIETLQHEIPGVVGVEPEGGKEARAWSIQPQVEAGNCYLPDGAPWLEAFISEFSTFPKGKHDDDVDAWSQALIDLSQPETTAARMMRIPLR